MSAAPRPRSALWWWPARVAPFVVLGIGWAALQFVTAPGNDWNDLVLFLMVSVGVALLAYGLALGVVAWLALRTWPTRPWTAGVVTGVAAAVPLVVTALVDGSASVLGRWVLGAVVAALVAGGVTVWDARRLQRRNASPSTA